MRTVLVTGASRGIGAAIARLLVTRGFRVIAVARDEQALRMLSLEKLGGGGRIEWVAGSVADARVLQEAVQLAISDGNEVIGIIINAGTVDPLGPVADLDLESLKQSFEVNVLSAFRLCQLAIPHLRKTNGTIILLSSGIVSYPAVSMSAYCCSKAAIEILVSVLAQEEKCIKVLGVRPGFVDTEMVAHLEDNLHVLGPDQHAYYRDTPRAQPFEAAEQIVGLLLSENAISGTNVDLYGVINVKS